jgi:hypothetical protein
MLERDGDASFMLWATHRYELASAEWFSMPLAEPARVPAPAY